MITAIATQKGGTGKTTTSINMAAGVAGRGKKVLLIDLDSQANSSKVLLAEHYPKLRKEDTICTTILDRKPLVIHPTAIPNLTIVPSHILLSNADVELTTAIDHREARLKKELDTVQNTYDYVFIDCPPSLGWLTINAFTAVSQVLIVVSPGYFELDSVVQISKTIASVQQNFNAHIQISGILFVQSEPTVASRTSLQLLRQTYPDRVLKTVVPRNTDLREAHLAKKDIFSYNPKSTGAEAYRNLIAELFSL
jgi:chromosome partitioning protein